MKRTILILMAITLTTGVFAQKQTEMNDNSNKLAVLWTSGDPDVAEKMVFMYTLNAKRNDWFDEVVLIIWGPSAKLAVENEMIRDYIKTMQDAGVKTEACLYCAKKYDVHEKLAGMGVDVKGMGVPLSDYLKEGWKVLSL